MWLLLLATTVRAEEGPCSREAGSLFGSSTVRDVSRFLRDRNIVKRWQSVVDTNCDPGAMRLYELSQLYAELGGRGEFGCLSSSEEEPVAPHVDEMVTIDSRRSAFDLVLATDVDTVHKPMCFFATIASLSKPAGLVYMLSALHPATKKHMPHHLLVLKMADHGFRLEHYELTDDDDAHLLFRHIDAGKKKKKKKQHDSTADEPSRHKKKLEEDETEESRAAEKKKQKKLRKKMKKAGVMSSSSPMEKTDDDGAAPEIQSTRRH